MAKRMFPKRFLWGASLSAYQSEGGAPATQWTQWEHSNAPSLAAQAERQGDDLPKWGDVRRSAGSPSNYVAGKASDHYARYEEDFDALKQLGLTSFHCSIEWARIEPEEGAWNIEAIEHYRRYFQALEARGIEPLVTLIYTTLPEWFTKKGGFEVRRNNDYVERYTARVMEEFGTSLRYIVTIHEPEIYAARGYLDAEWPPGQASRRKFITVLHNQLAAHKRMAAVIRARGRRYKVTASKNISYVYPGDTAWLSRISASVWQYLRDDYVLGRLKKTSDFLAVNYYGSDRLYGYRIHNPETRLSDTGASMTPGDIQYALERVWRRYKKPLIVTENGVADKDDEYREWWLAVTIASLQRAREHEVELEGYFYRSLLDSFEWSAGKWPRFGLYAVDYKTGERTTRPSARTYARIVKKMKG